MFSGRESTLVTVRCRKYRAQALVDSVNQVRKLRALMWSIHAEQCDGMRKHSEVLAASHGRC